MRFDIRRSLRRIKPERFIRPATRRSNGELPFAADASLAGLPLLLDTCVYIDVLQNRTPPEVDALLQLRTAHHISVCIAELTHVFGRLHPRHPGTPQILKEILETIDDIPAHRLVVPDAGLVAEAGILAGLLFRLGNLQPGHEITALNDATLYLYAMQHGFVVLTRNISDFDVMNQILPGGRILFYTTTNNRPPHG